VSAYALEEPQRRTQEGEDFDDDEYPRYRRQTWSSGALDEQTDGPHEQAHARYRGDAARKDRADQFNGGRLGPPKPTQKTAQVAVHPGTSKR